jgi:tripartite-type tricarboxylate transporter receptor subunit TctC
MTAPFVKLQKVSLTSVGIAALALATSSGFSATPASAEVSFAGKRIVWVVPSREGGGTDTLARFLVPYFKKHLPGNPTIVVQNIPGKGTLPGINQYWHNAKGDGLMILSMTTGGQTNAAFGHKAVQYKLAKYKVLMGVPQGTFVYGQPSLGIKGPGDIGALLKAGAKKPLTFGGQSPTSAEVRMLVAWDALGVNAKPVWGLSRGKSRKAFMRKEFDLMYDTASGWIKKARKLVKKKQAVPLFTFGIEKADGTIVRDPVEPNIPTFLEVYEKVHGKKFSGLPYKAWHATFSIAVMNSKAIVMHPKTRPEVFATYETTVQKILKDPKFKKAKKKWIGIYGISTGKRAQKIMTSGANIEPKACGWLTNFLKVKYDASVKCM